MEKQLKHSESFNIYQSKESFIENCKKFIDESSFWLKNYITQNGENIDSKNVIYKKTLYSKHIKNILYSLKIINSKIFSKILIKNSSKNDINDYVNYNNQEINSILIKSQRGDFTKSIIINFIYDLERNILDNSLHLAYAFLKNFENKKFFNWLSKDLLFNFVSRDLFNNNPDIFIYDYINNDENINSIFPEFFINIDLTELDTTESNNSFYDFILKITGVNSENIDMDYYKIFYDNLIKFTKEYLPSNKFSIKNFENEIEIFSNTQFTSTINFLKNKILNFANGVIDIQSFRRTILFKELPEYYSYLLNNILENYLNFQREINSNDILISQGKLSLLIKIIQKEKYVKKSKKDFAQNKNFSTNIINIAFGLSCVLERAIKDLSKVEIDIFRGDHNYILTRNKKFQGTGLFIIIPVLCVLIIFYEILEKIYIINNIENEINQNLDMSIDSCIANENHTKNKDHENNLKINLKKEIILKLIYQEKLLNYLFFQFLVTFFFIFFLSVQDLLNIENLMELMKNYKIFEIIKFDCIEKYQIKGILFLFICFSIYLIAIFLKRYIQFFFCLNLNKISLNMKNEEDIKQKLSKKISSIKRNISLITYLLYLGLNSFLIFFINYSAGLVYIVLLMIPEFMSLIIQTVISRRNNGNKENNSSPDNKMILIIHLFLQKFSELLSLIPLILILYFDYDNYIKNYFFGIFLDSKPSSFYLKFIYIDVLIFYVLKIDYFLYI